MTRFGLWVAKYGYDSRGQSNAIFGNRAITKQALLPTGEHIVSYKEMRLGHMHTFSLHSLFKKSAGLMLSICFCLQIMRTFIARLEVELFTGCRI